MLITFSETALVGVQFVVVEVPDAVVVGAVFFDEPLPLAVVVVDLGAFALAAPWFVFADVDLVDGPFVDGALVVVLGAVDFAVVFGELGLGFVFAAASMFIVKAAATTAAGSAIHLVIAPPADTVEQSTCLRLLCRKPLKWLNSKG